jgi:probable phosphomutase (TIGR03848 family)
MPLFLLLRHGENDYVKANRLAGHIPGVHLNENGRRQAQTLAEKLVHAPVKAIYSSPLERAMETAAPLSQALGLPVVSRPGLIETDCGEWQGRTVKQLSRLKAWKLVQNSPSQVRFPGGESISECQVRISQELLVLAAQHEPQDLLVAVSHADPIKLAVAYFLGLPLDNFQRLAVAPASITILQLGESTAHLLALNLPAQALEGLTAFFPPASLPPEKM